MSEVKENTRIPPEEMEKMKKILQEMGCWKEDEDEEVAIDENVIEGE